MRSAKDVFNEVGYEKTTFKEVAERAGVTRPAVNHHFGGKVDLFHAIFDYTGAVVIGAGIENARRCDTLTAKLVAFLETAVQVDSTDRSYARFIAGALIDVVRSPELSGPALGQIDEVRVFVDGALREAQRAGQVSAEADVSALTEVLVAMMWGLGLYAGFVGSHQQLESVVAQCETLLSAAEW